MLYLYINHKTMIIGEVGMNFENTETIQFLSDSTLLEYDMIIIDIFHMISLGNMFAIDAFLKRHENLTEYILIKKIPIVLVLNEIPTISFNSKTLYAEDIFPIGEIEIDNESGKQIEIIKSTPFSDFFQKYIHAFNYHFYITSYKDAHRTLLLSKHTRKILSAYNEKVVVLPSFKNIPDNEDEFLTDLYNIIVKLNPNNNYEEFVLPEWTTSYYLPSEKTIADELGNTQKIIDEAQAKLQLQEQQLQLLQSKKNLLVGSGDLLENAISTIFKELGFTLLAVEHSRDDLIVQYKERVAVVEIKGVTGTAAEKHAAQLEKWVANYKEEKDESPKGILIVNSFKDKELSERGETFPHQMLKYSTQREHCLLSTVQLLGLYYEVMNHPEKKEDIINSLFDTVGIYQGFTDWKTFIEQ